MQPQRETVAILHFIEYYSELHYIKSVPSPHEKYDIVCL